MTSKIKKYWRTEWIYLINLHKILILIWALKLAKQPHSVVDEHIKKYVNIKYIEKYGFENISSETAHTNKND